MTVPAGRIKVHDSDLFLEVLESGDYSENKTRRPRASMAPGTSEGRRITTAENAAIRSMVREREQEAEVEEMKREGERRVQAQKEQSDLDFHRRLDALVRNNEELSCKSHDFLEAQKSRDLRKKELLHQDWNKSVFYPIQDAISEVVDKQSSGAIEERRRRHLDEYLKEANCKVGVFRDIVVESDYDPLALRVENSMTARLASPITDPTHQATNLLKENTSPSARKTPEANWKSRVVLDVELWGSVEATPYAPFALCPQRRFLLLPFLFFHFSSRSQNVGGFYHHPITVMADIRIQSHSP